MAEDRCVFGGKDVMAKAERLLRKRFVELLGAEPIFNVLLDDGKTWLCPYCGAPAVNDRQSPDFQDLAFKHLIDQCPKAQGLAGQTMRSRQLEEQVLFDRLRTKYTSEPAWRLSIGGGVWLCPFCVESTDVKVVGAGGAARPVDEVVRDIHRHFGRCYNYSQNPEKWRSVEDIRSSLNERKRQESEARMVSDLMKSDPVFQFGDDSGHWICPFCEKPIDNVDYSTPLARTHTAPHQVLAHFRSGSCAYKGGALKTGKTIEIMVEVAARFTEKKAEAEPAAPIAVEETGYFKALRSELGELRSQIGQDKELQRNLERARKAQRKMLPSEPPSIDGYDLAAYFLACEQVSGDFYDFVPLSDDRIGVVMGDVSGHGIDAGIVMGMAKKAFSLRAQTGTDPVSVAAHVNDDIFPELESATFVTAIYGVLDPAAHTFSFVRCGHTFPIHYREATGDVEEVQSQGMVMGSVRSTIFQRATKLAEIRLEPGDFVVLFTDGLVEAMTAEEEEFGGERMHEAVRRHGAASALGVIEGFIGAIHVFTSGHAQNDDHTAIVIRREADVPAPAAALAEE